MGDFALKRQALWCEIRFFLILVVAAAMLTGCAAGESNSLFTDGLAYDEADHTWTTEEESFEKLVKIMRQECAYPDTASGVRRLIHEQKSLDENTGLFADSSRHSVLRGITRNRICA